MKQQLNFRTEHPQVELWPHLAPGTGLCRTV